MTVSIRKQRGVTSKVRRYRTMEAFMDDVKADRVPDDIFSPGYIAQAFGITRQAVHAAVWAGRVDAWYVEGGYVWISYASCARIWDEA